MGRDDRKSFFFYIRTAAPEDEEKHFSRISLTLSEESFRVAAVYPNKCLQQVHKSSPHTAPAQPSAPHFKEFCFYLFSVKWILCEPKSQRRREGKNALNKAANRIFFFRIGKML
jgi:hypothetical protein